MKKIITILSSLLIILSLNAQLPYSWAPGVNPGWSATNPGSGNALQWRPACNAVTTNCTGNYANNQNTTYTSPIIDASCSNASTISISFFIAGNAEFQWDFLFMEYSLNGGLTWINPYGPGFGLSGNAGAGITWTLPPIPTSNNFRFRFRFESDAIFTFSGYRLTNFSIICNVVLPIELFSFTGKNINDHNYIEWITASEINNDYFTLERSNDGENWERIYYIPGAGNSNQNITYSFKDYGFKNDINYYKLTQVDFDGVGKESFIISVNNKDERELIKTTIYDISGRVYENLEKSGLYFIHREYKYGDPEVSKIYIHY